MAPRFLLLAATLPFTPVSRAAGASLCFIFPAAGTHAHVEEASASKTAGTAKEAISEKDISLKKSLGFAHYSAEQAFFILNAANAKEHNKRPERQGRKLLGCCFPLPVRQSRESQRMRCVSLRASDNPKTTCEYGNTGPPLRPSRSHCNSIHPQRIKEGKIHQSGLPETLQSISVFQFITNARASNGVRSCHGPRVPIYRL